MDDRKMMAHENVIKFYNYFYSWHNDGHWFTMKIFTSVLMAIKYPINIINMVIIIAIMYDLEWWPLSDLLNDYLR